MNRIDQSHAPKLVTEDKQTDNGQKKLIIGLSAHAGAKKDAQDKTKLNIVLGFMT
jgi:hypothetical protein